jgi:hypothetical protein
MPRSVADRLASEVSAGGTYGDCCSLRYHCDIGVVSCTSLLSQRPTLSIGQEAQEGNTVQPNNDQIELLRSALARAYEKREPLPCRLVKAATNYILLCIPRKPIIESLNIIEKNKDAA